MNDLISRQAAIDAVEKKIRYTDHDEPVIDWNDFVGALCFLPSAQPDSNHSSETRKALDCISRQAAIELCEWYQHEFCECDYAFGELANELYKLPSAQPEFSCEGCQTPKHICGICMRNYPNITDHYTGGEAG